MVTIPRTMRWRIATALRRLPRACWAELVWWAADDTDAYRLRNCFTAGHCRSDDAFTRTGTCYCGKHQDPARWPCRPLPSPTAPPNPDDPWATPTHSQETR